MEFSRISQTLWRQKIPTHWNSVKKYPESSFSITWVRAEYQQNIFSGDGYFSSNFQTTVYAILLIFVVDNLQRVEATKKKNATIKL